MGKEGRRVNFKKIILSLSVLFLFASSDLMAATREIKIGVILPLSGPLASIGRTLKEGAELAADMVNGKYPGAGISIAEWEGIPGIGGAKIKLIFADSRGDPGWGANQAKRLIKEEKVIGLVGAVQSSVTKTASAEAEKAGIPFINPDSISPALSKRGFKWFWRVTPHESWFAADFFDFLDGLVAGRSPGLEPVPKDRLETLAVAMENTGWGVEAHKDIEKFAAERKYKIVESFKYPHKAKDLTSESRRMVASKAGCFLFTSHVADAIQFVKALKEMKASSLIIWGQHAGFVAQDFSKALGEDAIGILSQDFFWPALDKAKPEVVKINKVFKDKTGYDFNGNSARNFTGIQVFAHVLDIAGSTEPGAIQKALNELHIAGKNLIMPWQGVRFGSPFPGDTQQNELGGGVIVQYQGYPNGKPEIVYPFELATSKLIFPFPGWK
jgi:branched-chain amino acid transport system substrate-binding protein